MKDNVAHRKRVVVGATNLDHVEFISGVSAGDRLIITDMEDYIHLDQIEID